MDLSLRLEIKLRARVDEEAGFDVSMEENESLRHLMKAFVASPKSIIAFYKGAFFSDMLEPVVMDSTKLKEKFMDQTEPDIFNGLLEKVPKEALSYLSKVINNQQYESVMEQIFSHIPVPKIEELKLSLETNPEVVFCFTGE